MNIINKEIPKTLEEIIKIINDQYGMDSDVAKLFKTGILNTYQTTINIEGDETFIITGDIPAMWNRDSVAQIRPLLMFANQDPVLKSMIRGVIEIQKKQILIDPYANAFNKVPGNISDHSDDLTDMHDLVWERKFEIDSLCYPVQLAYQYYEATGDETIFDEKFLKVCETIVTTFITEQNHFENSPYSFRRITDWLLFNEQSRIKYETLQNRGMGTKVGYTGMIWSGFRPSDDACQYGYLVPSNMFAVVILKYMKKMLSKFYEASVLVEKIEKLSLEVETGIKDFAIIKNEKYGDVYAYEVDGLGNHLLMDDANVPSLMALPYLGYCKKDDPIYLNTRKMLLSDTNPFYYEGKVLRGIGSPHTPENYVWHIGLAVQGMTSIDKSEQENILEMFLNSHAGQFMMHEGVFVDNPEEFTRPWFSWANSMFAEFLLDLNGINLESRGKNYEL